MNWFDVVITIYQFALQIWSTAREKDAHKKELKIEILKEGLDAVTKKDLAGITRTFERINNLQ